MKKIEKASLLLGAIAIAAACSTGTDDADSTDSDTATGAAPGSGGDGTANAGGTSSNTGGGSSGGASGGLANGNSGGSSPSGGFGGMGGAGLPSDIEFTFDPTKDKDAEVCAAKQLEGTQVPLDMFIILDQSLSMASGAPSQPIQPVCPIGPATVLEGNRWCNAITALDGFFTDPSSVGMGIAYSEFESTGCDAFTAMDVPFNVIEAGDTNGHLAALHAALTDDAPDGGFTFTEGAVLTLIDQTSTHVPTGARRAATVLVTDGSPTGCLAAMATENAEMVELNALLRAHYQDNDIPNFIIGMDGADADLLEALAVDAGAALHTDNCLPDHTECSYYSVGNGDPAVFIQALESIRGQAVGCEYAVPRADIGVSVLDSLAVKYKQEATADVELLERVSSEAECVADVQYWVDTSGVDDAIVKLCPNTCDRRGPETTVELELACEGS